PPGGFCVRGGTAVVADDPGRGLADGDPDGCDRPADRRDSRIGWRAIVVDYRPVLQRPREPTSGCGRGDGEQGVLGRGDDDDHGTRIAAAVADARVPELRVDLPGRVLSDRVHGSANDVD